MNDNKNRRGFLLNIPQFEDNVVVGYDKVFRIYTNNDKSEFIDYDIFVDDLEVEIIDKHVVFVDDDENPRIEYKFS